MRYNGTKCTNIQTRFRETTKQFKTLTTTGIIITFIGESAACLSSFFQIFCFQKPLRDLNFKFKRIKESDLNLKKFMEIVRNYSFA